MCFRISRCVKFPITKSWKNPGFTGRTGSLSRTCHSCSTSLVHVAPATFLPVPPNPDEFTESTGVLADLEKSDFQTEGIHNIKQIAFYSKEKSPQYTNKNKPGKNEFLQSCVRVQMLEMFFFFRVSFLKHHEWTRLKSWTPPNVSSPLIGLNPSWKGGVIWCQYMGASLNGGTPKHPKMIIFSGKTHGCWGNPPF